MGGGGSEYLTLGSGRGRITREVDITLVLICSVNVTVDYKTAGFLRKIAFSQRNVLAYSQSIM